jgi:CRP-like cAMP-binding protein
VLSASTPSQTKTSVYDSLLSGCRLIHTEKNEIVYYQGEVPQVAYLLKKGCIKVYNISTDGDEQLVTFHVAGEFLPASWLFGYTPSVIYFYETVVPSEIYAVPKEMFHDYLSKNPAAMKDALNYYAKTYNGLLMRITALEQVKARAKIMYTLYYLAQRYGLPTKQGLIEISLQLTHQEFAHFVGLTRETIATEMKKLKTQGLISYKSQKYSVHIKKLLQHMGEDNFASLDI